MLLIYLLVHLSVQFSSVQLLSCVWLFSTPWTAAHQASLAINNSWSPLKLMSIESVMPTNHLILCHPFLLLPSIFPSIRVFSSESAWGGQSIGVSASTSVLPMNTQDWSPLGWTGWISLQSKGPSRVSSNTTVHSKGYQSWVFIGRTDVEAETPILWPPDVKSWLIGKDPDAGKDWRLEEKGMTEDEMVGWHHWLNGHEFG